MKARINYALIGMIALNALWGLYLDWRAVLFVSIAAGIYWVRPKVMECL